ncbi:hypothetical protein L1987_10460 [Smallanthus sonchifolius]|uniref:Uncharacterized protein n=1 Tax=Smallanthus sonchifolius TaxID=185202 RepID=A0ACB9JS52_9ASTR|nr:hypothetical protein L1987_10460 [Smallanthus sonchifolius]
MDIKTHVRFRQSKPGFKCTASDFTDHTDFPNHHALIYSFSGPEARGNLVVIQITMDLATSCKEKLVHFRIKELKHILTQLGLSKQGKKQDLADRILAIISDDRVSGMWAKKKRC